MTRDSVPPIRFQEACMALFTTPGKWMTILGICVCTLIPIAGPMVVTGFLYRRFAREREGHVAEDFDFNRFSQYLKWGLMPFLTVFVMTLVFQALLMIPFFLFFFGMIATASEGSEPNPAVMFPLILGAVVVGMISFAAFIMVSIPVSLRSAFRQNFASGFSWTFIKDFCKREGLTVLLWAFILGVVVTPLMFIGYFALMIGAYVVMAWYCVASYHLMFQHYDRYLAKGGQAIEIAPTLLEDYPVAGPPAASPPSLPQGPAA